MLPTPRGHRISPVLPSQVHRLSSRTPGAAPVSDDMHEARAVAVCDLGTPILDRYIVKATVTKEVIVG